MAVDGRLPPQYTHTGVDVVSVKNSRSEASYDRFDRRMAFVMHYVAGKRAGAGKFKRKRYHKAMRAKVRYELRQHSEDV